MTSAGGVHPNKLRSRQRTIRICNGAGGLDGGVSGTQRYRGAFQPGVWILGGTGHWAQVYLFDASARAEDGEDLYRAGQHDGPRREALPGGPARKGKLGTERGGGRRGYAKARKFAEAVCLAGNSRWSEAGDPERIFGPVPECGEEILSGGTGFTGGGVSGNCGELSGV